VGATVVVVASATVVVADGTVVTDGATVVVVVDGTVVVTDGTVVADGATVVVAGAHGSVTCGAKTKPPSNTNGATTTDNRPAD
jgi:hypothetical protein